MDTFFKDVRYAFRKLLRSPGFTLIAVLTLALGIGANSAIFSVVYGVLLKSLPFAEPDRLVDVFTVEKGGTAPEVMSPPDFMSLKEQNRVYTDMVVYNDGQTTLTGRGDPAWLEAAWVGDGFFQTLGVRPLLGRAFRSEENQPDKRHVVILSHGLWRQTFGSDPKIIGQTIVLNGVSKTVVGVMPPGFGFPDRRALWMPIEYDETFSSKTDRNRRAQYLNAFARLKPGVSVQQADAEMRTIAARLEKEWPRTNTKVSAAALPLHEQMVGEVRTPLLVMLGAVGLVLLIACANVANLLLARAAARGTELAVRTALGAKRGRLVRQMLTESVLLGLIGGALGLMLGAWGTDLLIALRPEGIPRLDEIGLDGAVVAFTAGIALLTGVIFGLIPALHSTGASLVSSLKEGGRGAIGGGNRVRSSLIVAEMAFAVMLLVGAGLLIRSFIRLNDVDPGFRADRTMAFTVQLPQAMYPEDPEIRDFYRTFISRLQSLPGVRSVGAISGLPLIPGRQFYITFDVEGRPPARPGEGQAMLVRLATPDFFRTLGVPLMRGRPFTEQDREGAQGAVILNEEAVERHFPNEDPMGKRINLGWRVDDSTVVNGYVVGIVGNVHEAGLGEDVEPTIYFAHAQVPWNVMDVVVRASGDPMMLISGVRSELKSMNPNLAATEFRTVDEIVDRSLAQPRFYMLLLTIFAAVALTLAAIGVFGVMSYSVAQRTREIGIRIALGADGAEVVRMVVGRAVALAAGGVALGLLGAFLLTRLMASLLYGVAATDAVTFIGVGATLGLVAIVASYLPARTATRVDPMVALRYE